MNSYTAALTAEQVEILRAALEEQCFEFSEKPHALYSGKRGKLNVTVYEKGPKVLVQGKETEDFVKFTLEPQVLGEARLGYEEVHDPEQFEPHFGIDESGKGDFFGPLVIAGVYVDKAIARSLMDAGIMDSKRITSANRIRKLSKIIRETSGLKWEMVSLGPQRYNEMHAKFRNLNSMLAWGHARVIEKLHTSVPACPRALSDQFARPDVLQRALKKQGIEIQLDQRTKGESDVAVAAASILARERFVDWMEKTSAAAGIEMPLGASNAVVDAARKLLDAHGREGLAKVAKMHFRTAKLVMGDDSGETREKNS
ncbi:MAG: ribonuclease HIII [Akkermansiaceae bacterium]|nr:ribonuclease HIII [Akkermansiaceae bacterium]